MNKKNKKKNSNKDKRLFSHQFNLIDFSADIIIGFNKEYDTIPYVDSLYEYGIRFNAAFAGFDVIKSGTVIATGGATVGDQFRLVKDQGEIIVYQNETKIVSEILKSTTIVSSLKDRISFGSSGYSEQKRMIQDRIKKINDYRTNTTKRENEISNALEILTKKISVLIK